MFKIGTVTHFYEKVGIALVELDAGLSVGDIVKYVYEGKDLFKQRVDFIQVEHDRVSFAAKGSVVGLETKEEVKEGAEVFKL